ncbi:hypothetical protein PISMIDRAFT_8638 [Pisolithus microcarpus 441]|uniref:Uncharacterized protein n=1 Tax=Pisolithus microcarpus 441 TaxID=765257 RepID=A0A0D0A476_9AGAM|nr:hypothetical protein BKA83DRAFT_8638 [Pisolithus microcarpus]KIK26858.1 hypothetical protein PISMIDRAFT_8638 [Pisolithus microcarpus 441]
MPRQQAIVTVTLHGGGVKPCRETSIGFPTEGIPEALSVAGGVPPKCDCAVISHEEGMNTGNASTQDASLSDACTSQPCTGAGELPHALNNASWMSHNPGHPVIPPHSSEKLDAAQRAVGKAAAEQRQVKQEAISHAVAKLLEEEDTQINEIVKAHCILPEKVKLLITGETHYRNRWEESLANALIHIKACQVNANHPHGQKIQLKELQEMVANDPVKNQINKC